MGDIKDFWNQITFMRVFFHVYGMPEKENLENKQFLWS